MHNYIEQFESKQMLENGKKIPNLFVGDIVEVHNRILEKSLKAEYKERVQVYKGTIIAYKKGGLRSAITVRKISSGIGVEKTFPIFSPAVEKIVRISSGNVRRAKLFYLRGLQGKKARIDGDLIGQQDK